MARRTHRSLCLLASLLLVALTRSHPATAAGSETPHIVDGQGDLTPQPELLAVDVALPEIDLRAVWLTKAGMNVTVSFRVQDLSKETFPDELLLFSFSYKNADLDTAALTARIGPPFDRFVFHGAYTNGTNVTMALKGRVFSEGNVIEVDAPSELFEGTLTQTRAGSILATCTFGSCSGGGPVWFRDPAPDTTYGPDISLEDSTDSDNTSNRSARASRLGLVLVSPVLMLAIGRKER